MSLLRGTISIFGGINCQRKIRHLILLSTTCRQCSCAQFFEHKTAFLRAVAQIIFGQDKPINSEDTFFFLLWNELVVLVVHCITYLSDKELEFSLLDHKRGRKLFSWISTFFLSVLVNDFVLSADGSDD